MIYHCRHAPKVLRRNPLKIISLITKSLHKNKHNFVNNKATELSQYSKESYWPKLSIDSSYKSIAFVLTELRQFLWRMSAGDA